MRGGRRQFSNAFKIRIVEEADRCTRPGEIGALLRREGLYSSSLERFRKQYAAGLLKGNAAKDKAARLDDASLKRIMELERENRRLRRSLHQAETILEVQKKLSEILGVDLPRPDENA